MKRKQLHKSKRTHKHEKQSESTPKEKAFNEVLSVVKFVGRMAASTATPEKAAQINSAWDEFHAKLQQAQVRRKVKR